VAHVVKAINDPVFPCGTASAVYAVTLYPSVCPLSRAGAGIASKRLNGSSTLEAYTLFSTYPTVYYGRCLQK